MLSFLRFGPALGLLAQLAVAAGPYNISPLVGQLSPGAEVFYPSAANWSEVTPRWSTNDAPTFFAAIKPNTTRDVQNIVRYASKNNIPFLGVGAGHGFTTTLGELNQGLEIDLSLFNTVSVDAQKNRLTIGGSVRFSDIMDPVYAAGKEIRRSNQREPKQSTYLN
jgi:FAD/FMN-containing dehydrogenase